MATLDPVANLVRVTVSVGYSSAATEIVLNSGQGALLPAPSFNCTWWNSTDYADPSQDPFVEIIRVTNVATDTLTISRAAESVQSGAPTAQNHNIAGRAYQLILGITGKMITDINAAINNAVVGYRTNFANFTTVGNDTSFTIVPPSNVTTAVVLLIIGSQQFVQGGGNDYTVSGNVVTLTKAYSGPSGAPVIVVYTY